nr:dTDP-4-dehydrorhamnose reductase [uncultured Porphyromonas sp.]
MNILVIGASGQLGQELRVVAEGSAQHYTFASRSELDVTDQLAIRHFVQDHHIDTIINCSAYTAVDRAEDEPEEADRINHQAVAALAALAKAQGLYLIHISTDYVFAGDSHRPITEEETPRPQSVYGRTKLLGEDAIRRAGCRALILRTSWLYSTYGANFLKTMCRLMQERQELSIVFDQIGTPTYARDLARFIVSYLEQDKDSRQEGTYHFSDEGVASWYDFAEAIRHRMGYSCQLHPIRSEQYPTKATRPSYSVLDKAKLKRDFGITLPHWQTSLEDCLKQLTSTETNE